MSAEPKQVPAEAEEVPMKATRSGRKGKKSPGGTPKGAAAVPAPLPPAPAPEPLKEAAPAPPAVSVAAPVGVPAEAKPVAAPAAAQPIVLRLRAQAVVAIEPIVVKVSDGLVYIKVKVGDALVLIKAKVADSAPVQKLKPLAIKVQGVLEPRVALVQAKLGDAVVYSKAKYQLVTSTAIEAYGKSSKAIDDVVKVAMTKIAARIQEAQVTMLRITEPVTVRAQGGYVFISGKVGDAIVSVKARRDSTKAAALEAYATAAAKVDSYVSPAVAAMAAKCKSVKVKAIGVAEPYYVKVQDGVTKVKGKVGDAEVYVKGKVAAVVGRASDALEPYCKPVYVKVKDRYVYVVGKVGDTVVYIRAELNNHYEVAKVKALATYAGTLKVVDGYITPVATKIAERYTNAKAKALCITSDAVDYTKTKAAAVSANAKTIAKDQKFQATAAAATSGAVAFGASGGAAGFVTGGTIGAAIGVVPALFTFGLSIPIGAAIGAGTGLCMGTAAGGTVGLVGGGAAGYQIQTHKKEIGDGLSKVRDTAATSTTFLKAKLVGGTGGTA